MSNEKKKQTPDEKLAILMAKAEADEQAERVLGMSDDEIAKELATAGVDVDAADREMRKLLAKHGVHLDEDKKDEAPPPPKRADVVPIGAARRRPAMEWVGMAVAAVFVLGIGWQIVVRMQREEPTQTNANNLPPPPAPSSEPSAEPDPVRVEEKVASAPPAPDAATPKRLRDARP